MTTTNTRAGNGKGRFMVINKNGHTVSTHSKRPAAESMARRLTADVRGVYQYSVTDRFPEMG